MVTTFDDFDYHQDSSHLKELSGFYEDLLENEKTTSKSEKINNKSNSISYITKNLDESFDELTDLCKILESKNDNEIKKIDFKNIKNFFEDLFFLDRKAYFRYIKRDEKNKINNIFNTCQYIPLINLEKDIILFHDGNGNGKYFLLKEILFFYNQLFIREDEINKNKELDEVFNEGYICKLHNVNYNKFCIKCKVNICSKCTINHINHEIIRPDENIKTILKYCQKKIDIIKRKSYDYFSKNKKTFNKLLEISIRLIYCFLMKKIIREKALEKDKYNYYIEQNIKNFHKSLKEGKFKLKLKNIDNQNLSQNYSIKWIIEFYSKKQIINNQNQSRNIWISVSSSGFVIIYLLNLLKDSKINNPKDIFNQLNEKKVSIDNLGKIIRLEGCFNPNEGKNYFLIGSFSFEKSIVISVTHDYKKIEEIQIIKNECLISSIDITFNNKYFLLQSKSKEFNLWYFDYINNNKNNNNINNSNIDKKELKIYDIIETTIEKEELKAKLITKDNISINDYREIISYVTNKNLLIVHNLSSEPSLLFYKLKQDEKLSLILIGEIKPKEDQNKFSEIHNNCIIIESKFFIIGAKLNKTSNNYGGCYVINIDKIEISYYYQEPNCLYFNSLLKYKNNKFICSSAFRVNNKINRHELILYEFIIEKNGTFKIINKGTIIGKHSRIIHNSIILDSFLITTTHKTNSLIKIDNDILTLCLEYQIGSIIKYFLIENVEEIPFKFNNK